MNCVTIWNRDKKTSRSHLLKMFYDLWSLCYVISSSSNIVKTTPMPHTLGPNITTSRTHQSCTTSFQNAFDSGRYCLLLPCFRSRRYMLLRGYTPISRLPKNCYFSSFWIYAFESFKCPLWTLGRLTSTFFWPSHYQTRPHDNKLASSCSNWTWSDQTKRWLQNKAV